MTLNRTLTLRISRSCINYRRRTKSVESLNVRIYRGLAVTDRGGPAIELTHCLTVPADPISQRLYRFRKTLGSKGTGFSPYINEARTMGFSP